MARFGVLKRVDLRLLWPHEALNFTTWLAQNLPILGDALGLDLELRHQDAPVGSFSLDILIASPCPSRLTPGGTYR